MSVMRIISYFIRVPCLKFVGLPVPNIRLIFGRGVNRPDFDVTPVCAESGSPLGLLSGDNNNISMTVFIVLSL